MSVDTTRIVVTRKKENKMAVSKAFFAELIEDLKADAIKREETRKQIEAEIAEMVANGNCPECLCYYCECY